MQAFDRILFFGLEDRFGAYCLQTDGDAKLVVLDAAQRDDRGEPVKVYEASLEDVPDINHVINDVFDRYPESFPYAL